MPDVQRQTYLKLMQEIEELEGKIEQLEKQNPEAPGLAVQKEQLAKQRNELVRISDGCGVPHHH